MKPGEEQKSRGRTAGRGRGKGTTSKTQSAQARARTAKKAVTIDLEAKDVTPKPQAKSTVPKTGADTRAMGEKVIPSKVAPKPAADSKMQSETVKATKTEKSGTAETKSTASAPKPKGSHIKDASTNFDAQNTGTATAPASPIPTNKTEKTKGSIFPNLVASIIGGVIAVGGFIGLQKSEVIPNFGDGGVAALTSRLTTLEDAPVVNPVSLDEFVSLSERLDEMEQGIENNDRNSIPEEVLARLTALEARLADAEGGIAPTITGDGPLPGGLSERLAAIEARLSANENVGVDGQIAALDERLATLDEGFAAVQSALANEDGSNRPTVDVSADSSDVNNAENGGQSADLKSQLAALQETVAKLEIPAGGNEAIVSAARESLSATIDPKFISLQSQLDETSSLLGAIQEKVASVDGVQIDIDGKLATLSEKLGLVEKALDTQHETTANVQLATKSLALENLKSIAQNGGAFSSALTSLERVGIEPEAVAALQPFSVTGLKDVATLESELNNLISLAAAKQSAIEEAPEELSAFEKLAKNAQSLIKIRSLKQGDDAGPFGQLPRYFKEGNMDGFLETLGTLSEEQRQVFDQWLGEWKGNLALSSLIQKMEQDVAGNPADEASSQ